MAGGSLGWFKRSVPGGKSKQVDVPLPAPAELGGSDGVRTTGGRALRGRPGSLRGRCEGCRSGPERRSRLKRDPAAIQVFSVWGLGEQGFRGDQDGSGLAPGKDTNQGSPAGRGVGCGSESFSRSGLDGRRQVPTGRDQLPAEEPGEADERLRYLPRHLLHLPNLFLDLLQHVHLGLVREKGGLEPQEGHFHQLIPLQPQMLVGQPVLIRQGGA